jgi:hypothetical protein
MAFIGMPRVLVLVRRHRLWPRTSVVEAPRRVEKRGELHFSAAQDLITTLARISTDKGHAARSEPRQFVYTANIRSSFPILYVKKDFFFLEMDLINRCAYFDYQMPRVYLHPNPL